MAKTDKIATQMADINALLTSAIPTLGLALGAINMVREMFRRKDAGEAAATFEENVALIHAGGVQMVANADAWFAAHPDYDPQTGKKL